MKYKVGGIYVEKFERYGYDCTREWEIIRVYKNSIVCRIEEEYKIFEI